MAKRPIYYDTETSGLNSSLDRIIELAAFDPVNNTTFNELINPQIPIPPATTAIHHITDEMVKDADTFEIVGQKFIEFCSGDVVLIAHNNDAFDFPFLTAEFNRAGLPTPTWPCIDSLKWARKYRSDLPRHNLQYLREIYGIESNQAHRALNDVVVMHKVFSLMIDDLSFETVLDLLSKKQKISRMTFGKHMGKPLGEVPKNYIDWLKENGVFDKPENKDLKEGFVEVGLLT